MIKDVVVVGAGYWGKNLIRNFQQLAALYGICESDPAVLRSYVQADPTLTGRQAMYRVDVPGGMLALTWSPEGHVYLTGPAVIVARGTTSL